MLIIENEDIEKLKDFGFKPKYDEDTGELDEYFIYNWDKNSIDWVLHKGLRFKKKKEEPIKKADKRLRIKLSFRNDERGFPKREEPKVWEIKAADFEIMDLDKMYDLIQAGIIKKI